MKDIIQSYFSQEAVAYLGQVVGLDPTLTQRALSLGLPLQIDALAAHAETPEGRARLGEAISNLPRFGSVQEALSTPSGAVNLQQAGELLAPALLGGQADEIVQQVTRRVGGSIGGVQKVMSMTLPLVLSLLGRQGMTAVNADTMLGRLRGGLTDLSLGAAAAPVAAAVTQTGAALADNAITPSSLLDAMKAEFSGATAEKVGRAAGFTGADAGKAVMGALPVVLNALVNKGRTEAGAGELLKQAQEFERVLGDDGHLSGNLLGDSAELARLESQGRGLLGGLFGNVDTLTGRLGTALGGSGANAGRLLALLTPMVLGLLGRSARTSRMSPLVLTGLLGAMGDKLSGLIPAGMTGLTGLLGAGALGAATTAAAAAPTETVIATAVPETRVVETPAPVNTAKPVTPPPPPVTPVTTTTTTERKGGIPWWVWLLPLLLLGGCWLANQNNKTTTPTTATTTQQDGGGIIVNNPQSDSNLPAEPFTMSGTAAPDMQLRIEDQGQTVAEATADAEGNWTAEIPAPTPGEHTYSIIGGDNAKSEFKVNVTDEGAGDATGTTTETPEETPAETPAAGGTGTGTFAISEPAESAEVSATGFNLKGTGEAGKTYELLEDGTSVGTFVVGDDGTWTADVAAPTAGDKTYTIRDSDGNEVATLPVKVATGTTAAGECTQDLSVSLNDGETVSAPFRFGGVGSGTGYTVSVRRAGRLVGTKEIPLGEGCTWSYTSNPGGKPGTVNDVIYEVRASGTSAESPADATLNLKVRAQ